MSWQEKAVTTGMEELLRVHGVRLRRGEVETVLATMLPLIEVTPAMRFAATGETRWAANPAEHADEILAVMLDRCAKERPQQ
jgi:hypothetical protein